MFQTYNKKVCKIQYKGIIRKMKIKRQIYAPIFYY